MTTKIIGVIVAGLLAIVLVGYYFHSSRIVNSVVGAIDCGSNTCLTSLGVSGLLEADGALSALSTFTLGTNGSSLTEIKKGVCNLNVSPIIIPGFGTVTGSCGAGANGATEITGIQTGDSIQMHLASTTPTSLNSLIISGYSASSTSSTGGVIVVVLTNASSSAITLTSSATSSLGYLIHR